LDDITVGPDESSDFSSIQEAINSALDNATIHVKEGVYQENLFINRSVVLEGASAETTIIDGDRTGDVIHIDAGGKATITGFTIRNSGRNATYPNNDAGIEITTNLNIIDNNIIENNYNGIYSQEIINNTISNNTIHSNIKYGIYMYTNSNGNIIKENFFEDNLYAVRIKGSRENIVVDNVFQDNQQGLYFCCGATNNLVYHNSFINNSLWQATDYIAGNNWDKGNEGNYWSDYNGTDADGDGIGDIPYNISSDGDKQDLYPLIRPIYLS
jgi:parallel beta-helix repeat protein